MPNCEHSRCALGGGGPIDKKGRASNKHSSITMNGAKKPFEKGLLTNSVRYVPTMGRTYVHGSVSAKHCTEGSKKTRSRATPGVDLRTYGSPYTQVFTE